MSGQTLDSGLEVQGGDRGLEVQGVDSGLEVQGGDSGLEVCGVIAADCLQLLPIQHQFT